MIENVQRQILFAGNSNPTLAHAICGELHCNLGEARVTRFSDGEIRVEIGESVRGADVYIIQSTCAPTNDNLMELLIMVDALKRASAGSISAVMPYFGYARQDRKAAPRAPITARLVCDLLTVSGVGRIITMELHAGQIQGFFNGPVDHLFCSPVMVEHLQALGLNKPVIVSPDAGGVERARTYAKRLNAALAIVDKRRSGPNVAEVMHLIGDVDGCDAVLVDDMIDTAGTICQAALAVQQHGAKRVFVLATHPVLSGPAVQRLTTSVIEGVIVSDTIPLSPEAVACTKITVVSTAAIFAQAIQQIHGNGSVSSLFAS
ncbi:MAG: ribose-phosphate pyrophosphokinase [Candidatus Magasanikbacteria bacterium]|nr:ribose-phosphate pyrophosphokinase [Candidatus Magasanikbacteria bacterium]